MANIRKIKFNDDQYGIDDTTLDELTTPDNAGKLFGVNEDGDAIVVYPAGSMPIIAVDELPTTDVDEHVLYQTQDINVQLVSRLNPSDPTAVLSAAGISFSGYFYTWDRIASSWSVWQSQFDEADDGAVWKYDIYSDYRSTPKVKLSYGKFDASIHLYYHKNGEWHLVDEHIEFDNDTIKQGDDDKFYVGQINGDKIIDNTLNGGTKIADNTITKPKVKNNQGFVFTTDTQMLTNKTIKVEDNTIATDHSNAGQVLMAGDTGKFEAQPIFYQENTYNTSVDGYSIPSVDSAAFTRIRTHLTAGEKVRLHDSDGNYYEVIDFEAYPRKAFSITQGTTFIATYILDGSTITVELTKPNNKVEKTTAPNKLYGTDADGNQTTYDKDLIIVDSFDGITGDENRLYWLRQDDGSEVIPDPDGYLSGTYNEGYGGVVPDMYSTTTVRSPLRFKIAGGEHTCVSIQVEYDVSTNITSVFGTRTDEVYTRLCDIRWNEPGVSVDSISVASMPIFFEEEQQIDKPIIENWFKQVLRKTGPEQPKYTRGFYYYDEATSKFLPYPDVDKITLERSSTGEYQVKDKGVSIPKLKMEEITKEEWQEKYDADELAEDTFYKITNPAPAKTQNIIDLVYRVGCIYPFEEGCNPNNVEELVGTTWEEIEAGIFLSSSGPDAVGLTELFEQLPNVKGVINALGYHSSRNVGAFTRSSKVQNAAWDGSHDGEYDNTFSLSTGQTNEDGTYKPQADSVYKDGGVVRPHTITQHYWQRIS